MTAAMGWKFYGLLMVRGRQISNSGAGRLAIATSFLTVSGFEFVVTQRWTDNEPTPSKERA
jgi:hypothetical protein